MQYTSRTGLGVVVRARGGGEAKGGEKTHPWGTVVCRSQMHQRELSSFIWHPRSKRYTQHLPPFSLQNTAFAPIPQTLITDTHYLTPTYLWSSAAGHSGFLGHRHQRGQVFLGHGRWGGHHARPAGRADAVLVVRVGLQHARSGASRVCHGLLDPFKSRLHDRYTHR